MSTVQTAVPPVRKSIVVPVSVERAFEVFTREIGNWWPLENKHIGKSSPQTAVVEPFAGGRWYERGIDGSECDWGRVRVWEPPHRLVLSWEISSEWQHDPAIQTEVEVRFQAEGSSTRVDLEHRFLHHYGAKAAQMQGIFESQEGWSSLLAAFAARAEP